MSVATIFAENGYEEHAEFKHAKDQKCVLEAVENQIKSGEQLLFFSHSVAGAVKLKVAQKQRIW